ncbi:MAG: NUDIX domain-containing protein [Kiritimatiellia bacterium]
MKKTGAIEFLGRAVCVMKGLLLVCHAKGAKIVYLPGGHVEFGEGAETAVCREIEEEMGKQARVKRFLGCVEHGFVQKGERHAELNIVFEVAISGLSPARQPESREDYIEFLWIPLTELKSSPLEPASLKTVLPKWLKGKGPNRWTGL